MSKVRLAFLALAADTSKSARLPRSALMLLQLVQLHNHGAASTHQMDLCVSEFSLHSGRIIGLGDKKVVRHASTAADCACRPALRLWPLPVHVPAPPPPASLCAAARRRVARKVAVSPQADAAAAAPPALAPGCTEIGGGSRFHVHRPNARQVKTKCQRLCIVTPVSQLF